MQTQKKTKKRVSFQGRVPGSDELGKRLFGFRCGSDQDTTPLHYLLCASDPAYDVILPKISQTLNNFLLPPAEGSRDFKAYMAVSKLSRRDVDDRDLAKSRDFPGKFGKKHLRQLEQMKKDLNKQTIIYSANN